MRYSVFGAALVGAMTLFALHPGYAEQTPATQAPVAAVTAAVPSPATATPAAATSALAAGMYSQSRSKLFDMKQCYEDDRGCQLATCVSQLTAAGPIVICQSHGTSFP
jgi:hypothetical protein